MDWINAENAPVSKKRTERSHILLCTVIDVWRENVMRIWGGVFSCTKYSTASSDTLQVTKYGGLWVEKMPFPPLYLSCTFALCRNPNRNDALHLVQTNTANLWKWMEEINIFLAGTRHCEQEGRNIGSNGSKDQSAEPKTLSSVSNL